LDAKKDDKGKDDKKPVLPIYAPGPLGKVIREINECGPEEHIFTNLSLELEGPIAIITLNRPDTLNVFTLPMLSDLEAALDKIIKTPKTKCIIFKSCTSKAFSAGADIREMSSRDVMGGIEFAEIGHRIGRKLELEVPPVVIALNGLVLGGACEFCCACDIRVATKQTYFSQPEINIGVIPGWGGTQRLMRLIGVSKAKEMIYTGNRVDADTALDLGLVNYVVEQDQLMPTVNNIATAIASKSKPVLMAAKQAFHIGLNSTLEAGLRFEVQKWGTLFGSYDRTEGMKAFLEKRHPEWHDR
jgi:enoyl-CoA hydratase